MKQSRNTKSRVPNLLRWFQHNDARFNIIVVCLPLAIVAALTPMVASVFFSRLSAPVALSAYGIAGLASVGVALAVVGKQKIGDYSRRQVSEAKQFCTDLTPKRIVVNATPTSQERPNNVTLLRPSASSSFSVDQPSPASSSTETVSSRPARMKQGRVKRPKR